MGQKINSNFTRLNLYKNYLSAWYNNKIKYSSTALEDAFARFYTNKVFGEFLNLANISVKRVNSKIKECFEFTQIIITAKLPSLLKAAKFLKIINYNLENNSLFTGFTKKDFIKDIFILIIKKYAHILSKRLSLKYKKRYQISFIFISNRFTDANLIANYMAKEILKKKNIIYVLKNVIKNLRKVKLLGAFIQLAGRLQGAERAKIRWLRFGSVPVQTFSKNIVFAKRQIKTTSGIIGVKVQIFLADNVIKPKIYKISKTSQKSRIWSDEQECLIDCE